MAFTVRDFHDLVEIMETQPVWRAEMRRLVLSDDILKLPQEIRELSQVVREFAEASQRHDERLMQLETEIAEVNKRNEARFTRVETNIAEIKGDVSVLKGDVSVLKSDVSVLKSDVSVLKSDVSVLKSDVSVLKSDVSVLKSDVAGMKGENLERRVREHTFVFLSRFARRVKLVSESDFGRLIEDAVEEERLREEEAEDLKWLDIIALGQDREQRTELYLACEVSSSVSEYDLARAISRAALLQKATGVKTMPVILGKTIPEPLRKQANDMAAGWVLLPN